MRRILSLAPFLLLALFCAACVSGPSTKDVLAVGFRTPEQTFASFQTAFRGNLVDLEYRCFSEALKRSMGSQVFYREERKRILSEQPFIKLAATAKVIDATPAPRQNHCRLIVQIDSVFLTRSFAVELVREGFYDIYDEDGVAEGVPKPWRKVASARWNSSAKTDELVLCVPMPEGYVLDELTGFSAGLVWKIDSFSEIETP